LGCLATHVDKLNPRCWSLVAVFDKQQLDRAKILVADSMLEPDPTTTAVGMLATSREDRIRQGAINVDAVVDTVRKQVHGELHEQLQTSVEQYAADLARGAKSTGFLWGVMAAGSLIAILAAVFAVVQLRSGRGMVLIRRANRDGGATVVVKDGRA
jgi:hypothetical protein